MSDQSKLAAYMQNIRLNTYEDVTYKCTVEDRALYFKDSDEQTERMALAKILLGFQFCKVKAVIVSDLKNGKLGELPQQDVFIIKSDTFK